MVQHLKRVLRMMLSPWLRYSGPERGLWLTFDDGPAPATTPRVLDALDTAGVSATFFMIGREMERHPELVEVVRQRGHGIALHGYEHRHVADLTWREQWRDLEAMRAVAQRFQVRLRWYRPPYGELSVLRLVWCAFRNVTIIMWNYESRDSFVADAPALIERLEQAPLMAGHIALFHDDTPATAEALPTILVAARRRGLAFTLPEA